MNTSKPRAWRSSAAFCLLTIGAIACSNLSPSPTPTEPLVLQVLTYDTPPISQVFDILTQAFVKLHPEVTVTKTPITSDPTQQIAGLAKADNAPDVIWTIDAITPSLIDARLLLNLDELANVDSTFKRDDINPSALAAGNGRNTHGLYMIPAVMESVQMFYNQDMFKQAGAPYPDETWKWDDLIAACKKIQDTHANVKCLGYSNQIMPDPSWWAYLVPWIRGYGGDVLSADGTLSTLSSPESLAGIQAYTDLWTKDQIAATPEQRGNCFVSQHCAVIFFVAGGIGALQQHIGTSFNWDVQLMPLLPKGRFTGTGTYGFGISSATKRPELAWDYIKLLATPGVQRAIALQRVGMPVLLSLANDPVLNSNGAAPANMQVFTQGSQYGLYPPAYPTACGNFYSGLVQTAISDAFKEVLNGARVEDAFKTADQKIQACLDTAK
ncbi:MAG: sugar ABC transporter substrate-binding protein [Chloroflexi bacterium]|nr:sugar ABC transporter substrate-binding protein [Chloroflexota bacterium]MCL5273302.1 sugar ABC transporter substrate-binding protein [Chloroflexota bacterium]